MLHQVFKAKAHNTYGTGLVHHVEQAPNKSYHTLCNRSVADHPADLLEQQHPDYVGWKLQPHAVPVTCSRCETILENRQKHAAKHLKVGTIARALDEIDAMENLVRAVQRFRYAAKQGPREEVRADIQRLGADIDAAMDKVLGPAWRQGINGGRGD